LEILSSVSLQVCLYLSICFYIVLLVGLGYSTFFKVFKFFYHFIIIIITTIIITIIIIIIIIITITIILNFNYNKREIFIF